MNVAIMQPYFLPYIGYFQLIKAVDIFVVYDNIQFSKKGWIHRNRILVNGRDEYFTLTLKKDSDYLNVNQRVLSETWEQEKLKTLRIIKENYKKAPFFLSTFPILEEIFNFESRNLFDFIYHSLLKINSILEIESKIVLSSSIAIDHDLKAQNKVLAINENLQASHYINPIGGLLLYDAPSFEKKNIELSFLKSKNIHYKQYENEFMPWLSILDVMMFNDIPTIKNWLGDFDLQKN
jgi:hypothetical protein